MTIGTPIGRQRDESPSAAEQLLKNSSFMFQLLFERSADAIFLLDKEGTFVDCNLAAVELLLAGTKERILRARPEDLSPPLQPDGTPSREKTREVMALVEKRGRHRFEWVVRRFDGQEVPLEVLVTQLRTGDRVLNVAVPRDITERKRTEAALRESEQKFRELFEASSDAIQILDPQERRIVDCNAATLKMVGLVAWTRNGFCRSRWKALSPSSSRMDDLPGKLLVPGRSVRSRTGRSGSSGRANGARARNFPQKSC